MELDLKEKVSLITGSAQGVGRSIAEKLAKEGSNVIISDINYQLAKEVAINIKNKYNVKTAAYKHDVASKESTEGVIKSIIQNFGSIDILVNNAGITRDTLLMTMSLDNWSSVLDVNLTGPYLCTKYVSKHMLRQRKGSIINISSIVGIIGNVGQSNYSASKAGLIGLTKTSAREFATKGITVNAIAPGYIESEMTARLPEKVNNNILHNIPVKHYGVSDDIANLTLFLVSDKARYITGQVINVDGGMIM